MVFLRKMGVLALGALSLTLAGCGEKEAEVSFANQVQPILEASCVSCHVEGAAGELASGLQLESYEALMAGTRYGPVVIPGNATESALVQLIEGRADPSITMPHGGQRRLYAQEMAILRQWVEQGARDN